MPKPLINKKVLMSGAEYFRVKELNPYSSLDIQPDINKAIAEHNAIKVAFTEAGIEVISVKAPANCQDGIYTANWGLCWKGKAVLASLPKQRQAEQPYAKQAIQSLGYNTVEAPFRFSGQGDCLPCGNFLFVGSHYRTDPRMHDYLKEVFDCEVIGVRAIPALDNNNQPVINATTGWDDSYFYDLDLAIGIISPNLIAWCPEALTEESRLKVASLPIEKIEVSLSEAKEGFGCNLVSTGEVVIMSSKTPNLQKTLESRGLRTITPNIHELTMGGGYIRCSSLTLA